MNQIALDGSLMSYTLTAQISCAESPLALFLFALSFYGESLGGCGFATVLSTIALQAPLDSSRGELSSDTRTLTYRWETLCGKIGEIWKSEIATIV